jgi:hypothetical protein
VSEIRESSLAGWKAVVLADDRIEVTVLPDKGADIYSLVDRPSGVDVLLKTPWGLQPPGAAARAGSEGMPFLENYEGGWQELLPNTNDACRVDGRELPFHGEVATMPWRWDVDERAGGADLHLTVDCRLVPLRLLRVMRLLPGSGTLELEETVTNIGDRRERFVWGHHLVLGAPLIAAGARMSASCRELSTIAETWENTARLQPGQRRRWPIARLRTGGDVDLSHIPGPDAGSHDDVYLGDLEGGWAEVENAALGLRFRLEWTAAVFPWIISWQPYGGAHAMPLAGAYGLGVEPWMASGNLAQALERGQAGQLEPGETLHTVVHAKLMGIGDG